MRDKQELNRSIEILEGDAIEHLREFVEPLSDKVHWSEQDFSQRWDSLRRDLREVALSCYEEHQRYSRRQKKIE